MIRTEEQEALRNIPDDAWILYQETDTYRRYICQIADGRWAAKTEHLGDEEIIEQNRQDYDDSIGKPFGDGAVVGRIPLNVLYSPQTQIMEKLREGDKDHMKWFLNSEHGRPYRSFWGKV